MGKQHERLALQPSSAKRWTTCTASPLFIQRNAQRIPEEVAKPYADEGTIAHEHAANWLLLGCPPDGMPDELQQPLSLYVETVMQDVETPEDTLTIEEKVPLWYMPERNGTIDARVVSTTEGIVTDIAINDYKHGAGVLVECEGNPQLLIYARSVYEYLLTLLADFSPECRVTLRIVQPRCRAAERPVSEWVLDLQEMLTLTEPIARAARLIQAVAEGHIDADELSFSPDDALEVCGWCPAKGFCPARLACAPVPVKAALGLDPDPHAALTLVTAKALTPTQVVALWRHGKTLKRLVDDAEELLLSLPAAELEPLGLKRVASKGGHRKWTNEDEAVTLLAPKLTRPKLFEEKMISPSAVEKLLDVEAQSTRFKNRWAQLVTKGEGKPTLAPLADPRPALDAAPEGAHPFTVESDNQ